MTDAPGKSEATERLDTRLLEFLVCPVTKGVLEYDTVRNELVSRKARLAFPIRNGVALMTKEAARSLDGGEDAVSGPARSTP